MIPVYTFKLLPGFGGNFGPSLMLFLLCSLFSEVADPRDSPPTGDCLRLCWWCRERLSEEEEVGLRFAFASASLIRLEILEATPLVRLGPSAWLVSEGEKEAWVKRVRTGVAYIKGSI